MISILRRLFIREDRLSPADLRSAYGILCGMVGIFLNICLFVGKYVAGVISGSISITADAVNNLSDAGSSIITLAGFKFGSRKADKEHPFGHGRYEYISGLAVSVIILLVGYELLRTSIGKIISPEPVEAGILSVCILIASILVKFYMFFYNRTIGKKLDSPAMQATAADSLNDCIATGVVLLCMLINLFANVNVDGWGGLFVAAFILYAGFNSARETLSPLLGKAPEPEVIAQIEKIALGYPEILAVHDLVVHDYGPGRLMVSLHAEVSGKDDIYHLHDIIEHAEADINKAVGCESVIHMDPVETDNEEVTHTRELVAEAAKSIHPEITIHDFRMVRCSDYVNLIFDAVLPLDSKLSKKEFRADMQKACEERLGKCNLVMKIDHPYV